RLRRRRRARRSARRGPRARRRSRWRCPSDRRPASLGARSAATRLDPRHPRPTRRSRRHAARPLHLRRAEERRPMTTLNPAEIKARLKTLGLFGLLACLDEIADKPWLQDVLAIEERERQKRSLERRLRHSRVAAFKPMSDFDWAWPKK